MLSASRQDGFTLIELMVALVLLTFFMVASGKVMLDWFSSSSKQKNSSHSQAQVSDTLDLMGQDIRATLSPDRAASIDSLDSMRSRYLENDPPLEGDDVKYADIVKATSEELIIRTDTSSTHNGSECVTYTKANSGQLTRSVGVNTPDCSDLDSISRQVLLPKLPGGVAKDTPIFTYFMAHGDVPGGEAMKVEFAAAADADSTSANVLDPSTCTEREDVNVAQVAGGDGFFFPELNFITAVHVDLGAYYSGGTRDGGEARASDTFVIDSRASHTYKYAIGCAY